MTPVFPGSPAARDRALRLLGALGASLALHCLALAALPDLGGRWAATSSGAARVAATLRAAASGGPVGLAEDDAPTRLPLPRADPEAGERQPGDSPADGAAQAPPDAGQIVAALGQRRLEADLPAYLAEPWPAPRSEWYFPRAELSQPPTLLDEPQIRFPETAGADPPRRGQVVVRVLVGAGGAVDRVEVAASNLPRAFEEAAVAAFARLHFRPGAIEGVAVTSEARFEVVFDPGESGDSHSASWGVGR